MTGKRKAGAVTAFSASRQPESVSQPPAPTGEEPVPAGQQSGAASRRAVATGEQLATGGQRATGEQPPTGGQPAEDVVRRNAELLAIAREVATVAGALILKRRAEGVQIAATKSTPLDVVTHADRESEALIRSMLVEARPDDAFLGEESDATEGSSGLTWVVDPIDGTVNFLYGIPDYAVSIAVVEGGSDPENWRALAGVVVNPASGETFTATAGGGAYLHSAGTIGADTIGAQTAGAGTTGTGGVGGDAVGVQLAVNADVELASALIGTGFGYSKKRRQNQADVIGRLIGGIRDIRRAGSASLDLCFVAAGRLDAFFERGLQPWDHAAGALIAAEAGARVGGLRGRAATSDMVVAAAPALFAALEQQLAHFNADRV